MAPQEGVWQNGRWTISLGFGFAEWSTQTAPGLEKEELYRVLAGADWLERKKEEIWEAEREKEGGAALGRRTWGKNRFIAGVLEYMQNNISSLPGDPQ